MGWNTILETRSTIFWQGLQLSFSWDIGVATHLFYRGRHCWLTSSNKTEAVSQPVKKGNHSFYSWVSYVWKSSFCCWAQLQVSHIVPEKQNQRGYDFSTMIGYWEIFQSQKAVSHMRVTTVLTILVHNWRYGAFEKLNQFMTPMQGSSSLVMR